MWVIRSTISTNGHQWRKAPLEGASGAPIDLLPFLKWAGGKRWLTQQYRALLATNFERYIEPFLGSGAVFFHLQPDQSILGDSNAELINTYRQIRRDWRAVQRALRRHHKNHNKIYYYEERVREHTAAHEKAAQFIYLNRTCWNGLYRVNLRGEFNVPKGTKTAVILETDDFARTASALRGATLVVDDFERVIGRAGEDDFAFIDPPYITRHNFNGFVKYNDQLFCWSDQERLAQAVRRAARRGVKLLITNAAHQSIRDLYAGVGEHHEIHRNSLLAANSEKRGLTTEIAITINYKGSAD